ncbi:MAG: LysM peptidoglycan-binding domain-containing protein [Spirochaetes bacterium]|nr:LysM peptidoglycan-binding domain-containing protein [Spirochaetota bacterium]
MATKPKTGSAATSSASKKKPVQKKSAPQTKVKAKTNVKKTVQKPKAKPAAAAANKTTQKPKAKTSVKAAPQKTAAAKKAQPAKPVTSSKPKKSTTLRTQKPLQTLKKASPVKEEEKVTQTTRPFEDKFDEIAATTLPEQEKKSSGFSKGIIAIIIAVILVVIYLLYPGEKADVVKEEVLPQTATQEPATEEVKIKPQAEIPEEVTDGKVYTVKHKDQLTEISKEVYGNHAEWKKIYQANKDKIDNPDLIFPGQKLVIPE